MLRRSRMSHRPKDGESSGAQIGVQGVGYGLQGDHGLGFLRHGNRRLYVTDALCKFGVGAITFTTTHTVISVQYEAHGFYDR